MYSQTTQLSSPFTGALLITTPAPGFPITLAVGFITLMPPFCTPLFATFIQDGLEILTRVMQQAGEH